MESLSELELFNDSGRYRFCKKRDKVNFFLFGKGKVEFWNGFRGLK